MTDEKAILKRALARCVREVRGLVGDETDVPVRRAAELAEQNDASERRTAEIDVELQITRPEIISANDVGEALGDFDALWDAMTPREQVRLMHLLVSRVDYDAADSSIEVGFHAAGIRALADEATDDAESTNAPESRPRSRKSKEAAA